MAISGYGLTLAGASIGALTGVKSISVGGLELDFDEIKTVSDTNRITEHLPLAVREQPMEVTFVYNKTIYDTLRDAVKAQTEDTFTLTDSENSTHVGLGYVGKVGSKNLDTDGHAVFSATLQPKTSWAFTAG